MGPGPPGRADRLSSRSKQGQASRARSICAPVALSVRPADRHDASQVKRSPEGVAAGDLALGRAGGRGPGPPGRADRLSSRSKQGQASRARSICAPVALSVSPADRHDASQVKRSPEGVAAGDLALGRAGGRGPGPPGRAYGEPRHRRADFRRERRGQLVASRAKGQRLPPIVSIAGQLTRHCAIVSASPAARKVAISRSDARCMAFAPGFSPASVMRSHPASV